MSSSAATQDQRENLRLWPKAASISAIVDGGHLCLVKGSIEFYYSDAQGNKYYFAFARY